MSDQPVSQRECEIRNNQIKEYLSHDRKALDDINKTIATIATSQAQTAVIITGIDKKLTTMEQRIDEQVKKPIKRLDGMWQAVINGGAMLLVGALMALILKTGG